jgi:hypothetical protein
VEGKVERCFGWITATTEGVTSKNLTGSKALELSISMYDGEDDQKWQVKAAPQPFNW